MQECGVVWFCNAPVLNFDDHRSYNVDSKVQKSVIDELVKL